MKVCNMTPVQVKTLRMIRQLLQEAYADHMLRGDGADRKSSDGKIEIYYPGLYYEGWSDSSCEASGLGIYSYAFGPSRMHTWHKRTSERDISHNSDKRVDDPFATALVDVKQWLAYQLASANENEDVETKEDIQATWNVVLHLLAQPKYTSSSVTSEDIKVWANRPDATFLHLSWIIDNLIKDGFVSATRRVSDAGQFFHSQVSLTGTGEFYGEVLLRRSMKGKLTYA